MFGEIFLCKYSIFGSLSIMASAGQRRGMCGQVMAICDLHLKCARYRDKGIGDDLLICVAGKDCKLCNSLSPEQLKQLATLLIK